MNKMTPPSPAELDDTDGWRSESRSARNRNRAKRFWRWLSLSLPNSSSVLFRQKITGLDVDYRLRPGPDGAIDRTRVERRIERLRARARTAANHGEWSIANELEMLNVALMDAPTMRVEFCRQLVDARALSLIGVEEYEGAAKAEDEAVLRAALMRLVADNQGKFRKRHLLREYVAAYTARVSLLFSLSTTFFIALIFALAWIAQDHIMVMVQMAGDTVGPPIPPKPTGMQAFASFYVALSAGLFGAAFSMMSQTRKRVEVATLDDMRTNARFAMLFFRLGVGIGAATILYFLFNTEAFGKGALLPNLPAVGFDVSIQTTTVFTSIGGLAPNRDLSLLMLWSFVAGFSEVMVPSILRRTEGTVQKP